jgi:hypothetical protein
MNGLKPGKIPKTRNYTKEKVPIHVSLGFGPGLAETHGAIKVAPGTELQVDLSEPAVSWYDDATVFEIQDHAICSCHGCPPGKYIKPLTIYDLLSGQQGNESRRSDTLCRIFREGPNVDDPLFRFQKALLSECKIASKMVYYYSVPRQDLSLQKLAGPLCKSVAFIIFQGRTIIGTFS